MFDTQSIYLIRSGRICVAGLNDANIGHVAQSFADVVKRRAVAA